MNFSKRAVSSVVRKPGKTVILLVIVFILGNIIAGAVSVLQAAGNAEITLRAKMSPVTGISVDGQKYAAMFDRDPELEFETLTVETIEQIGALPQVKYYDYSDILSLETPSLERYALLEEGASARNQGMSYFLFRGVHYPEVVDIQQGLIRLVSGRVFTEQEVKNLTYVALISKDVADINDLSVGSVITVVNNVYPNNEIVTQTYEFEIIGIFEPANQISGSDVYDDLANRMYTSNRVLNEASAFQIDEYEKIYPGEFEFFRTPVYSIIYVLNDPADLEPFREAVSP
ncbi:MAG: ABC transporter permease [Peptococcaceae bacterium]|nr:ABC transporter permease [Peptococcaceae bacterium]